MVDPVRVQRGKMPEAGKKIIKMLAHNLILCYIHAMEMKDIPISQTNNGRRRGSVIGIRSRGKEENTKQCKNSAKTGRYIPW